MNIIKVLNFPEQYKIMRTLPAQEFALRSNMTKSERVSFVKDCRSVTIAYDIRCANKEELMVLWLDVLPSDAFTNVHSARAIASGIPYYSAVIVENPTGIAFFTFAERTNRFDPRRMKVKSSNSVWIQNKHIEQSIALTTQFLASIQGAVPKAKSPEDLIKQWSVAMSEYQEMVHELKKQTGEQRSITRSLMRIQRESVDIQDELDLRNDFWDDRPGKQILADRFPELYDDYTEYYSDSDAGKYDLFQYYSRFGEHQ